MNQLWKKASTLGASLLIGIVTLSGLLLFLALQLEHMLLHTK